MMDTRANDDRAFAPGQARRDAPLSRETDQRIPAHDRVLLLPGRRVGRILVVVIGRIFARQAAADAVLGDQQVVDRGDRYSLAAGSLDGLRRNAPAARTPFP